MQNNKDHSALRILLLLCCLGLLLAWPTPSRAISPDDQDLAFNSCSNVFCYVDCHGNRNGDTPGFKGILARWCPLGAIPTSNASDMGRQQQNAGAAWQYRHAEGVTGPQWWHRSSDRYVTSWKCSSASSILQNILSTPHVCGTLTFDSIAAVTPAQTVIFPFRAVAAADTVKTLHSGPNGSCALTGLPPADYMRHIKGHHSLAVNLPANSTHSSLAGINPSPLRAGDANNANHTDITDFGILSNACGGSVLCPDSG